MDEGADTGDILSQIKVPILLKDDAQSLYEKVSNTALYQIEEFTKKLKENNYNRIPQKAKSGNTWRKRGIEDGKIDWRMNSIAIYNLVRALAKPYVGAHIIVKDVEYKIWKARIIEQENYFLNLEPGKVLKIDEKSNTFRIKTYDGIIEILEHNIDNIKSIGEYL